jgi:iron complex outermembrane receptor protein
MHKPSTLAALALLAAGPGLAQGEDEAAVVVTATRFREAQPVAPFNISVVPRSELRRSPATSLPELLRQRAGIEVRSLFGPLAIDATVDMRGFGESAGSNVLILVDGQRLNAVDSGSITWSAVPLSGVERIEIIRGAGTVLYGDRAVGGVVNIITDKSGRPSASLGAGAGYYGYKSGEASIAVGSDAGRVNAVATWAETDGYRRNSQADQRALAGRLATTPGGSAEIFTDFALFGETSGLPGALFRAEYEADPSASRRPLDTQRRAGYRARPGLVWQASDDVQVEAEVGIDHADTRVDQPGFRQDRDKDTASLTPRLRWRHGLAGRPSDTVAGVDAYDSEIEADSFLGGVASNRQEAQQRSLALYVQNTTQITEALALTAGARRQRLTQEAEDRASGIAGATTRTLDAYDLGLAWTPAPAWRAWGRIGRTFRFPNTDELFGFDPLTFETVFRGDLRPQKGPTAEIGAGWRGATASLGAALYRLDLTDEIGLDSVTFTNVNLPRTRRQGMELEGEARLGGSLRARATYTLASAQFRDGPDSGNRVPLVARHKGSLGLSWEAGHWGLHTLAATFIGPRHYAGDTANAREKLAGYGVADWRSDWELDAWQLTLRVLNLFDKRYAQFAGVQAFPPNDFFYYPADARTLIVSAAYRWQ